MCRMTVYWLRVAVKTALSCSSGPSFRVAARSCQSPGTTTSRRSPACISALRICPGRRIPYGTPRRARVGPRGSSSTYAVGPLQWPKSSSTGSCSSVCGRPLRSSPSTLSVSVRESLWNGHEGVCTGRTNALLSSCPGTASSQQTLTDACTVLWRPTAPRRDANPEAVARGLFPEQLATHLTV